ncbi:MAG TPA: glycosyltransferase [Pyrinomonadaceae bacterium]|nr:glycosyltransferase [Pyrinomonadaceae bacterium]
MSSPAVSVILPVYNGEDYVGCAIESVLAQTMQDFELIVVDDGSRDSTPTVVQSYGDRVRYVRQENGGVASAFNHGLRLARGRYVSWLSHDDVFLPTKLEEQLRAVAHLGTPAVCYTDIRYIDEQGVVTEERELEEHPPGEVLRNLIVGGPVSLASYSLLYDRRCVEEVGTYDEAQRYTQDADMLVRLARRFPVVRAPGKLMSIRRHGGRSSVNEKWVSDALDYYRGWLERLSLKELFPELGDAASGAERARALVWLGDGYAKHDSPPYPTLAAEQYIKALRESRAALPSVAGRMFRLWGASALKFIGRHRHVYRIGLRSALSRRVAQAKR